MNDERTPLLPPSVINCAAYDREGRRRDIDLEAISDVFAVDDGSFVWIGLYEPDEGVLEMLQEEFGLHDLAIEDAHKAHQRPKLEAYGDSLFLVAHTVQVVGERIRHGETHAFLGPRYLVTVRHGHSLSYAPARARLERDPTLMALGPASGLYAVLDAIVDHYLPIVDEFSATLQALEQDVFSETYRRGTIRRLYDLKRELTHMRVAVTSMQDVLSQLVRTGGPLVSGDVRLYLRDVLDHSVRANDAVDLLRDMLGTALGVNQALVTLAQGEVVKRLAGWAALLAAPTLIASWYGMNFIHMPELHGRWSYPVLVGVVVLVVALLYRYLRKVRWL